VQDLLRLLGDPSVRKWLEAQKTAQPTPQAEPSTAAPAEGMSGPIDRIHKHLTDLVLAVPQVPAELSKAGTRLGEDLMGWGVGAAAMLVAAFLALGLAVQWIFSRAASPLIGRISSRSDRFLAIILRLAYLLGSVGAFALGSLGPFVAFEWPPTLKELVIGYLTAGLATGLAWALFGLLLAPSSWRGSRDAARLRIIPLSDEAASFWTKRLTIIVGWFAFGWVSVHELGFLGVNDDVRRLIAYALGLVLLALGIAAVWQQPSSGLEATRWRSWKWFFTLVFLLLWLLWVGGDMRSFWLLAVAVALPVAIALEKRSVAYLLRAPDATEPNEEPSVAGVFLERGLRLVLILAAVAVLAWAWEIDYGAMGASESFYMRLARGGLAAAAILIVADFIWNVARSVIAVAQAKANAAMSDPHSEEGRRQARIRTLLPIAQIALFVVIATIAVLMALSELGVQIAPLIAGAGIVGVAVGFGSQTLVRDIMSGIFYLVDDAFRVGEYIQSGNYKGTVESFSLRSVRLRHQRGAVYTIPYGMLGAIQNLSRDWVIDKIKVGITTILTSTRHARSSSGSGKSSPRIRSSNPRSCSRSRCKGSTNSEISPLRSSQR
jgi:small-conductance mechanosensitive channel